MYVTSFLISVDSVDVVPCTSWANFFLANEDGLEAKTLSLEKIAQNSASRTKVFISFF